MIDVLDIVPGVTPWTFIGLTVLSFFTATFGVVAGLGGGVLLLAVMATIFPPATLIPLHGTVLLGTNVGRGYLGRLFRLSCVRTTIAAPAFLRFGDIPITLGRLAHGFVIWAKSEFMSIRKPGMRI